MKQENDIVSSMLSLYRVGLCEQEEALELPKSKKIYTISVPKEIEEEEKCVAISPDSVQLLVEKGFQVVIEKGAGEKANFSDLEYSECGGVIVSEKEIAHRGDLVLKINHPIAQEASMLKEGSVLISSLNRKGISYDSLQILIKNKVTSLISEDVISLHGFPLRNILLPIKGKAIVFKAAELLTNKNNGSGILLGGYAGINPAEILLIGAGIVAKHVAELAIMLGANVKVFSSSLSDLYTLNDNLKYRITTNLLQSNYLYKALSEADVIINTTSIEHENFLFSFNDNLLNLLKKNTVLIDSIVRCQDISRSSKFDDIAKFLLKKYGIIFCCTNVLSSSIARTISLSISNINLEVIEKVTKASNILYVLRKSKDLHKAVYLFNGILTDPKLGRKYKIPHQNLDLLLSIF